MRTEHFKALLASVILVATGAVAYANDPGGGTNGVGADVTLTDNGSTVTLANGIITMIIDKGSAELNSLKFLGKETVLSGGGNVYYSMDGGTDYRTLSGCAYVIKTNSADMVDVSFRQTWSTQVQAFDIEAHWVLRRGDSGPYAYALLDHPASYPDTGVTEWRMVWKLPNDLLERVYVDELRHWQMPTSADFAAAEATTIPEIVKLTTGVRAGRYDSKYEYAAEYENIGCWGHASNPNKIGAWFVPGSFEYYNDGPTKQDLTLAWDYALMHMGRNHFSPGSVTYGTNGIAWSKIYGPFLLYCNTNAAGGDALWADAKAQALAERAAWPYAWLTGNTNYPLAGARGAVSGRFLVNDALKSSVSTSNAWVGLTDPSVDWQFDSNHYEYWVRSAADGSFQIANVRPGTYTLHAFTDGEMGEYAFSNVVVTIGTTNALGDKTWNVQRAGNFLAWEVGVPNRTTSEFRHGSSDYFEGFIWNTFAGEFPNPLEFNVGASDLNTLNYVHSYYKVNGVRNQWKWRFNFLMTSTNTGGNATLNLAFASSNGGNSQSGASMDLFVNNEAATFTSFTTPSPPGGGNALQREGNHAKYYLRQVSIPSTSFRVGTNMITLVMTTTSGDAAHVMYDAISLELPAKPPLPAGYDLTWLGGLAANLWDLTVTNWSSNSVARVFANGNRVLFDDTGLNSPSIVLTNALAPAALTVYAMKSFSFTGGGSLSGAMTLGKTGPGTLTINTTNSFTGATGVTNGALIVNGTLAGSAVTVRSGALLAGTGRLGAGLTLQGGSLLAPGNGAGTITVTNTFTESGGVTNYFDLSSDPTGTLATNDLIKVIGNVVLAGTNTFVINPLDGDLSPGVYPLIQYTGTLTGGTSNLVVRGVVGKPSTLTNFAGTLALLVIQSRPPTNVVWKGGLAANAWDQSGTSNWLNGATSDVFAFDDSVTFDDTGSTSPAVNVVGDVNPSSVLVNAAVNYTFTGSGSISSDGGLTKNNSGTLTILTTNDYTGVTTIAGGALAVAFLDNGGLASGLGAATADSTNVVIQGGATLRYLGATTTVDRGATISGAGAVEITNGLANLTLNGNVDGDGVLVKNGPGLLTLGGSNSYAGGTLISAGTLRMGAGATSGTLGTGNVTNNSLLVFNRSDTATVSANISGSGNVTKIGGGTIVLAGANTYSGGTSNSTGALLLTTNSALGTGPLIFTAISGSSVQLADGVTITNAWLIPASTADVMMDCPSGVGTWTGPVSASAGGSFRPGTTAAGGTLVYIGNASIGGANFIVPRGNVAIASNGIVSAGGTVCAIGRSTAGTFGVNLTARDNAALTFGTGLQFGGAQASPGPMSLTVRDNALVTAGSFNLHNSTATTSTTAINLNGGTLAVGGFTKTSVGAGQISTMNFNGGVLKATAINASFLPALSGLAAKVSAGGAKIDDGGFAITVDASLAHDSALGATPDGGFTKSGAGTLTLTGPGTYTGPTFINAGTLALLNFGTVSATNNLYVAAGAMFDTRGTINNGNFTFTGTGRLSGYGTCFGLISLTNGAVLAPGSNVIGTLTFTNFYPSAAVNLRLQTGSASVFRVSHAPMTNDVAKIYGRVSLGGTLIVTNAGGSALAAGDVFRLIDCTNFSGSFAGVQLPALAAGLAWNTNGLTTNGTVAVVLNTTPFISSIFFTNGGLAVAGTGGVGSVNYFVLSATNLATPLSNWVRVSTNTFDGAGGFLFTNVLAPEVGQRFYRVQF